MRTGIQDWSGTSRSLLFALTGILFFVVAGGPVMLITWLAAAAAAVKMPGRPTPMPAAPTTP